MGIRTKILTTLIGLCIVDAVIPVPILGVILIYVVFRTPPWFRQTVDEIYRTT